jgi:hypothetical protein
MVIVHLVRCLRKWIGVVRRTSVGWSLHTVLGHQLGTAADQCAPGGVYPMYYPQYRWVYKLGHLMYN